MKKKLSTAIFLAGGLALLLGSMALAADPPAQVMFTTDAPCAVTVIVTSYTDPLNQPGQTASGSTPWTLDTYPSTTVTFFYPASVNCGGTIYNFLSVSPGDPVTSGAAGSTTTVTGYYSVPDTTPPIWTVPANFSVEATESAGAVVTYTASVSDPDDVVASQSCTPASGSTFVLGTTTVNCTATDTHGNIGTASFNVTVVDTTPPALTLPPDMTVQASSASGAVVSFTTSATDLVDGSVTVTCLPTAGSLFPIGQTTVACSAADTHGNFSSGSFKVAVVDDAPPVLTLPGDITASATDPSGAVVSFTVSATDLVDGVIAVTCSPPSGSHFSLGQTTVNCSATDSHGNAAGGSFKVSVVDDAPPVLTLPLDITDMAKNALGTVVTFTVSATDVVDGPVLVTCLPPSGSLFPIGQTIVNCSATDSYGNTANGSFLVTVVDNIPPVLTLPSNITVTAQNASGAVVNFIASATDAIDGPVPVACSPTSGSLFPIGQTTVNCSASDAHGNFANGSFIVSVQYAAAGNNCKGVPGHEILQPINADGSNVFKQGSTVPAKFRVCGTDGYSIGTPGVVTRFRLIGIISNGTLSNVDETVLSTPPETEFRSGNQQWIFNIDTKDLLADSTYIYLITLNDGSTIQFQFALK